MNSIILCEGSSDFVLLQYYMRTVYGWTDERTQNIRSDSKNERRRKVSRIVWKIKSNTSLLKCRISEKKKLQRITTATLTKLFDISIVAKRCSGRASNRLTKRSRGDSSSNSCNSSDVREK